MTNVTICNDHDREQAINMKRYLMDAWVFAHSSTIFDAGVSNLLTLLQQGIDTYDRRMDVTKYRDRGLPDNMNTVCGYLAATDPERLRGMDDRAYVTSPDGKALSSKMRRIGWSNIPQVTACEALREQGVERVNVYPRDLLQSHFGS